MRLERGWKGWNLNERETMKLSLILGGCIVALLVIGPHIHPGAPALQESASLAGSAPKVTESGPQAIEVSIDPVRLKREAMLHQLGFGTGPGNPVSIKYVNSRTNGAAVANAVSIN